MTDPLDALVRSGLEMSTEAEDVFTARTMARHYSRQQRRARTIRLAQTGAAITFSIFLITVFQAEGALSTRPVDLPTAAFAFIFLLFCGALALTQSLRPLSEYPPNGDHRR